jgi:two-component sensor histidine kinase
MPVTAMREQSVSCCLDREATEARRAREETRKALSDWGLGEHVEVAVLIVSELVTNVIRHGEGQVKMRISRVGGYLHIEVHDDGSGRPVRRPVTAKDESGRGLELVDGLLMLQGGSRTMLEDDTGAGKTVSVAMRLAGGR